MKSVRCSNCGEVNLIEESSRPTECICDLCDEPLDSPERNIKQVECVDCDNVWFEHAPGWVECPDCENIAWVDKDGDNLIITHECVECDEEWEGDFNKWVECPSCETVIESEDGVSSIEEDLELKEDRSNNSGDDHQIAESKVLELIEEFGVSSDYQPLEYTQVEDLEEVEDFAEVHLDNQIFLNVADKDLYQHNPFRLLGVDIHESERNIRRQAEKIRLQNKLKAANGISESILPLVSPPDASEIQTALQVLNNPEIRLLYELFWVWSYPGEITNDDEASQYLKEGRVDKAITTWENGLDESETSDLCAHNLAVVFHVMVLDSFAANEFNKNPNGKVAYKKSLFFWSLLHSKDEFWKRLEERVTSFNDPRIRPHFVNKVRNVLPLFLSVISCRLALETFQAGDNDSSNFFLNSAREQFQDDVVTVAAKFVCTLLLDRLFSFCEHIIKKVDSSPKEGEKYFNELLGEGGKILSVLYWLLPHSDSMRFRAHDKVIHAGNECVHGYVMDTDDWASAKILLESLLPLALRETDKKQIAEAIDVSTFNVDKHLLHDLIELTTKIIKALQEYRSSLNAAYNCSSQIKNECLPLLQQVKSAQGVESELYIEASTIYCLTINNLAVILNNEHQEYDHALKWLTHALGVVGDPETRQRLEEGVTAIRNNKIAKDSHELAAQGQGSGVFGWVIAGGVILMFLTMLLGGFDSNTSKKTSRATNYRGSSQNSNRYSPGSRSSSKRNTYITPSISVVTNRNEVKKVQMALNVMGYSSGYADGVFGNRSKQALKKYQAKNYLTVDALLTPSVKNKIINAAYSSYENKLEQVRTILNGNKERFNSLDNRIKYYENKSLLNYTEQNEYDKLVNEYNGLVKKHNSRLKEGKKLFQEASFIYNKKE